jgi:hypothetical protein
MPFRYRQYSVRRINGGWLKSEKRVASRCRNFGCVVGRVAFYTSLVWVKERDVERRHGKEVENLPRPAPPVLGARVVPGRWQLPRMWEMVW